MQSLRFRAFPFLVGVALYRQRCPVDIQQRVNEFLGGVGTTGFASVFGGVNAGFANVPGTVNDGFGFGDNLGQHVMFLKRADSGYATAWGTGGPTAAIHAPLSFTVTADTGYSISVDSFTMTSTGATGSPALWAFQEENTTQGAFVLDGGNASPIIVDLASPVLIAEGTSKKKFPRQTFSVYRRSLKM